MNTNILSMGYGSINRIANAQTITLEAITITSKCFPKQQSDSPIQNNKQKSTLGLILRGWASLVRGITGTQRQRWRESTIIYEANLKSIIITI